MSIDGRFSATERSTNWQPTPPLLAEINNTPASVTPVVPDVPHQRNLSSLSPLDPTRPAFEPLTPPASQDTTPRSHTVAPAQHCALTPPNSVAVYSAVNPSSLSDVGLPLGSLPEPPTGTKRSHLSSTAINHNSDTSMVLGSSSLLPGSTPLPNNSNFLGLPDSPLVLQLRQQAIQRRISRTTSIPRGEMSSLVCRRNSTAHDQSQQINIAVPHNVPSHLWPEFDQNILSFLDLRDEGVRNSLEYFKTSNLERSPEILADRSSMSDGYQRYLLTSNVQQRHWQDARLRLWSGDSAIEAGEYNSNIIPPLSRPDMSTDWRRDFPHMLQGRSGNGNQQAPRARSVTRGLWRRGQNTSLGPRQDMTMWRRQETRPINERNLATIGGQNMQATAGPGSGYWWTAVPERGYGSNDAPADLETQLHYGQNTAVTHGGGGYLQEAPTGPRRQVNSLARVSSSRGRIVTPRIMQWVEDLPSAERSEPRLPTTLRVLGSAPVETLARVRGTTGRGDQSSGRGAGEGQVRRYASPWYNDK